MPLPRLMSGSLLGSVSFRRSCATVWGGVGKAFKVGRGAVLYDEDAQAAAVFAVNTAPVEACREILHENVLRACVVGHCDRGELAQQVAVEGSGLGEAHVIGRGGGDHAIHHFVVDAADVERGVGGKSLEVPRQFDRGYVRFGRVGDDGWCAHGQQRRSHVGETLRGTR